MTAPEREHTAEERRRRLLGSLRGTWRAAMGAFVSMIVVLVLLGVALAQYQQELFSGTTVEFEQRMGAVIGLESELRQVDDPAAALMYQIGGPDAYPEHERTYAEARARIYAAFDDVAAIVGDEPEGQALARALTSWQQIDTDLSEAPARLADGSVHAALASGQDPWAETWHHLGDVGDELTDVRVHMVSDLRQHMAVAERVHRLILPLGAAVLLVALVVAALAGRLMKRRVIVPILALRDAAAGLRDPDASAPAAAVDAHTVSEVADLALALQDTAGSLRASRQLLLDQAHTDPLTGLANRAAFTEALDAVFSSERRGSVAALFIDLDDFKVVNDTLGHAAGDELLTIVARRLEAATRGTTMTARLGGDEFAVVLRDVEEATAVAVAERILVALDAPVRLGAGSVSVGCSIGVAVHPVDGAVGRAEELIHHADQAMYTAKKHGKQRLEVFSADLYARLQASTELRSQLAGALARGEFRLHYQPILDLEQGDVLGVEALIRWQHPTRGLLAPGEFVPLSEESGDIVGIGAWVIDEACQQLASWHDDGTYDPSVWVSVNVSARQLERDDFAPATIAALMRHGLSPASLVLEITEAVAVTNTAQAVEVLGELRAQGITVALDDFGMGFSSLAYLTELPIDVLKIDRSFLANDEPKAHATLQAIVMLGRRLGLRLIAEGIETTAHLDSLRALGPLAGQGYLFGRPVPEPGLGLPHPAYPRSLPAPTASRRP